MKTFSQKQQEFLKMMDFRHACKVFDKSKKVSDEDMEYILEIARLSPSSFGMEGWKFLVVSDDTLKQKLKPACWNQNQITSASHLVILLAAIDDLKVDGGRVKEKFLRRNLSKEQTDAYVQKYASHLQKQLSDDERLYEWSARQTYIVAANMMSGAAYIEIDSCPIEGFEKEKVEEILTLDSSKYQVALVLAFGYRANQQPQHLREELDTLVEFL